MRLLVLMFACTQIINTSDASKENLSKYEAIEYMEAINDGQRSMERSYSHCPQILMTHAVLADLGKILLDSRKYKAIEEFYNWWDENFGLELVDYGEEFDVQELCNVLNGIIDKYGLTDFGPVVIKEGKELFKEGEKTMEGKPYYYIVPLKQKTVINKAKRRNKTLIEKCNTLVEKYKSNAAKSLELQRRIAAIKNDATEKIEQINSIKELMWDYASMVYEFDAHIKSQELPENFVKAKRLIAEEGALFPYISNKTQTVKEYMEGVDNNNIEAYINAVSNMCKQLSDLESGITNTINKVFSSKAQNIADAIKILYDEKERIKDIAQKITQYWLQKK